SPPCDSTRTLQSGRLSSAGLAGAPRRGRGRSGTSLKLPALATALCLAATGLVVAAPGGAATLEPSATRTVSSVDWSRCSDPTLRGFGARCGFVKVPLDYADPGGRQI